MLIAKILSDPRELLRAFLEFKYFYVSAPVIAFFRLEKSINFPHGSDGFLHINIFPFIHRVHVSKKKVCRLIWSFSEYTAAFKNHEF